MQNHRWLHWLHSHEAGTAWELWDVAIKVWKWLIFSRKSWDWGMNAGARGLRRLWKYKLTSFRNVQKSREAFRYQQLRSQQFYALHLNLTRQVPNSHLGYTFIRTIFGNIVFWNSFNTFAIHMESLSYLIFIFSILY